MNHVSYFGKNLRPTIDRIHRSFTLNTLSPVRIGYDLSKPYDTKVVLKQGDLVKKSIYATMANILYFHVELNEVCDYSTSLT